ncbi:unnamed protein product [Zymoseptoria tritici ST99CH_3D1]|nr:unnamed protein product [Zymoseptoria tritici ST99CH_3D1]
MHFTTTVLAAVLLSYHQTLGSALPAAPNPAASVLDEAIATAEAQASNVAAFIQGVSAGLKPTTQPAKPTQPPKRNRNPCANTCSPASINTAAEVPIKRPSTAASSGSRSTT